MRTSSATWRGAAVTGFAFLMMALGGCGSPGDVEPAETPPSASTSSPSPSQTPEAVQPPEQPAAMSEPTTEGAIAAATYVLELFTYTFASGDTGPWKTITSTTCAYCVGVTEDVLEMVEKGDRITGGGTTVLEASATEIREDTWFSVDLVAAQEPSQRVGPGGDALVDNANGDFRVAFALSWDAGWRVDEMGIEARETETSSQ